MRSLFESLRGQHYVQAVAAVRLAITLIIGIAVTTVALVQHQPPRSVDVVIFTLVIICALALNLAVFWLSTRQRIDRWLLPIAILDSLLIGVAVFATGGIASPLSLLLLFPIGQVAVTVSMTAGFVVSLAVVAIYSLLAGGPLAAASFAMLSTNQTSVATLERFSVVNVIISDLCYLAFAGAAGWIGDALRRQEFRLLERSSRLRGEVLLLSRLAKTTSRQTDLAPVLQTVIETLCVELSAERVAVILVESSGADPLAAATHGFQDDANAIAAILDNGGPAIRAIQERRTAQTYYRNRAKVGGIPTAVAAPLLVGNICLGCLYLDGGAKYHRWTRDALELLSAIADLTGVAIQNAQLYAAAASEQLKLEAAIGAVSDAMLLFDTEGKAMLANNRFTDLFGLPSSVRGLSITALPALGRNKLTPNEVISEEQGQAIWSNLLSADDGEIELFSPLRILQRKLAPVIDEQGQRFATVLTLHDVTDERQSQLAKDELLSSVSHELRTPLTTVKGYTQIFLRRLHRGSSLFAEYEFHLLLDQIERLTQLVDQLLDVSHHPERRGNGVALAIDLKEIVSGVVQRVAATMPQRRFIFEPPDGVGWARGNSARIAQALENLLNNAIKFSPEGTHVYVRLYDSEGNITISVRDEGIGVPDEHTERIFEPFYRVDNSTTRQTGGLGLGLYVSKLIAEQHGGTLTVESEPGSGSTFTFSLPVEK